MGKLRYPATQIHIDLQKVERGERTVKQLQDVIDKDRYRGATRYARECLDYHKRMKGI